VSDTPTPIDQALFDSSVGAADDFYRHGNGGWVDANPVPPGYGSWGSFHEVNERNLKLLHALFEGAADDSKPRDDAERMVGDYFAAAMDESSIAAAGAAPLCRQAGLAGG